MGNANGTRKRCAKELEEDELMRASPPTKRRRLQFEEPSPSYSGRSSTTNTTTSDDSSPSSQKASSQRRRRLAQLKRFLSLSSGLGDYGIHQQSRDTHSVASLRSSTTAHTEDESRMSHTVSLTSLSHRRDYPTPWLEALFLPVFPTKGPRSLSEKSFQFYEEIGRGAFGSVRRAQLRGHDRRMCAIKIQEKSSILIRGYVEHVKDEVQILRRLPDHPFIIQLYASWQSRTRLFSCFEFPNDGCEDLFRLWRDCGTISETAVRMIMVELAIALDFLHRHAVIYRDLKLDNVLIDGEGHLRLADFGMAKVLRDGERTRTVCGTLQFMAPEVAAEWPEGYGHSADWWCLAVLAHVLLTGRYPYPNSSATHHSQLIYIDYSTPPGRSIDISSLFDMMLQSRVERRLKTFDELKSHTFFSNIDWQAALNKKYSLLPHLERARRIAKRRRRLRFADMINEETDEECDFSGFTEQYEFHDSGI